MTERQESLTPVYYCLQFDFARKCQLDQHKTSAIHKERIRANSGGASTSRQQLLSEVAVDSKEQVQFAKDVTSAFVQEGIPLYKLEEGPLRKLFEKYCPIKLPSVSTLRRTVSTLCEENLSEIRRDIGDSNIWLTVDEATDPLGRYIANIVVGKLDENKENCKGHLIHVAQLEKTNSSTIVQAVQEALRILWRGAPNTSERLLLIVTDSVAYMLSAGRTLKELYPKVIHSTCLAHGLHRIAETIREEHPLINKLVSVGKKIFLKAPKRVEIFKRILPNVPLPPEPVITRWGTWLTAVLYYANHFDKIKQVIEELEEDAASIKTAKELVRNPKIMPQLIYIESNFKEIPKLIEELQSHTIPLTEAISKMEKISEQKYPSVTVNEKVRAVLERNCGWNELKNLAALLRGEVAEKKDGWTIKNVLQMKFAPTTSSEVERTFSKMKYLLSDRRLRFTVDNFSQHLILFFNKQ